MTDKMLVKEYKRIHAQIDKAAIKLVSMGLGNIKPSDLMKGRDTLYAENKTVRRYLALLNKSAELRYEADRRYGPGLIVIDQLIWRKL